MSLFNYIIKNNNCSFNNNKKNVILLIRRSPGEIDWILPLLYNIKKEFNIFTIFRSSSTLNLTKENKILFNLWKKTSFAYTVEPKLKNIFPRLGYHLFKRTILRNILKNKFQKNYYDIKIIKNLISKNNKNFIPVAIFAEFVNFSPWIDKYKIENRNLKTIHFPHTTNIFGVRKKKFKNKKNLKNNLFLSNSYDVNYWQKKLPKHNIIETGYLKYDRLWLKKIISKKKKKNKKIIFLSLSGFVKWKHNYHKYKQQIKDIMDVCVEISGLEIFIKCHPTTNKLELKKILSLYSNKKWKLVNDNQFNLISISDICVVLFSSATILDSLTMKKVPIELWDVSKKTDLNSKFAKLNLSLNVKDKNDFKEKLNSLLYKKKYNKIKLNIKKNFKKNFITDGSINYTKTILNKILEE